MLNGPEHADRLVAYLPAVAIGAMQEVASPAFPGADDVGQVVHGAGCEQHPSSLDGPTACEPQCEAGRRVHHAVFDDLDPVAPDLGPCGLEQAGWGGSVAGEEALHAWPMLPGGSC